MEQRHGTGHIVRVMRLGGPVTIEMLEEAMRAVQARHPLLRARIVDDHGAPCFELDDSQPVAIRSADRHDANTWMQVLQEELNDATWPEQGPLVRMVVLQATATGTPTEVVLSCHHAVADGRSINLVCGELVDCCERVGRQEQADLGPPLPLLPPVEEILRSEIMAKATPSGIESFVARQVERKLAYQPVNLPAEGPDPARTGRSAIVHRALGRGRVAQLRERCRFEKTSVHGALGSALLLAAQGLFRGRASVPMTLVSTVSLRDELTTDVAQHAVGLFSSGARTFHVVGSGTEFWPLAREVKDAVDDAITRQEPSLALLLQREAVEHHMEKREVAAVWISNLGDERHDRSTGRFVMEAIHGGVPMHGFGPTVYSHAVTLDETLFWNFVYPESVLSHETVEGFADDALARMTAAANER